MVRTEGLAPPITRARGERVSYYTTSGWSSARESHPAFLHVGQAWSLAHSPTKLAAEAGFAPASRRLTIGRSTVELPGNGGQARIRTVISSVWERGPELLDDPP